MVGTIDCGVSDCRFFAVVGICYPCDYSAGIPICYVLLCYVMLCSVPSLSAAVQ